MFSRVMRGRYCANRAVLPRHVSHGLGAPERPARLPLTDLATKLQGQLARAVRGFIVVHRDPHGSRWKAGAKKTDGIGQEIITRRTTTWTRHGPGC